jgi:hypothetical protein
MSTKWTLAPWLLKNMPSFTSKFLVPFSKWYVNLMGHRKLGLM